MKQIFKSFAELASSAIAERWRAIQDGDRLGAESNGRHEQVVEATIQITLTDEDDETTAHVAVECRPG